MDDVHDMRALDPNAVVTDESGREIGQIAHIYLGGRPRSEWVAVKTGPLPESEVLVPVHGASSEGSELRVPYPKEVVDSAPRLEDSGHLRREQETELHRHYGLWVDPVETREATGDDGRVDNVIAEVLAKHGVEVSGVELADALDDLLGTGSGPGAKQSRTSSLDAAARGFLDKHGGIDRSRATPRAAQPLATAMESLTALSTQEAAGLLAVDPSRVRHRAREHQLYATHPGRGQRFPRWQFDEQAHQSLPHLAAVMDTLPDELHPVEVRGFFETPAPELEVDGVALSPRHWLLSGGDQRPVVELAAALET